MFVNFGIAFWLSWIATILALVSTASMFPEMVSSGSIDLLLAKPIGRWRLFLTKYATGLLFVALQVAVFCTASFVVIGWRGGAWEPAIFLGIPIVVAFYSYLFSVCALLGLLTRSTIAALILTLLFWFAIFAVHATESGLLMARVNAEMTVESIQSDVDRIDELRQAARDQGRPVPQWIQQLDEDLASARESQETWRHWHGLAFSAKTALPKTSETIALLERWMISLAELPAQEDEDEPPAAGALLSAPSFRVDPQEAQLRMVEIIRGRSVWWVLGTSLAFEAVILLFAGWRFKRRDF
jgi:ABC-type transport system involved in multi-copper enzyme maturation permease subunit